MRKSLKVALMVTVALAVCVILFLRPEDHSLASAAPKGVPSNWEEWRARCFAQPSNQSIQTRRSKKGSSAIAPKHFAASLKKFFANQAGGALSNSEAWVGGKPNKSFYRSKVEFSADPPPKFQPFAQKLALPSSAQVIFMGDLHGDVRSLLAAIEELQRREILRGFQIVNPDSHLVFLGDYTDRGYYGAEVIYTLLWLKGRNPDNVWMARGNHEDLRMIEDYGFKDELDKKFGKHYDINRVARLYDFLPVVIYVGCEGNYLQCNHGGIEPGYHPKLLFAHDRTVAFQLLGALKQKTFLHQHPQLFKGVPPGEASTLSEAFVDGIPISSSRPAILGFMWNDFTVFEKSPLALNSRPTFDFGKHATSVVLKAQSTEEGRVRGVFRAHQHSKSLSPLMQRLKASNGVFRHWQKSDSERLAFASAADLKATIDSAPERPIPDGSVHTFNVSPDSIYGLQCEYGFATIGILNLAKKFEDWRLEVVPIYVTVD